MNLRNPSNCAHSSTDWDVVVVGAGAAGLMAAYRAASRHRNVLLVEKNRKTGVKILMSGGTRCNLTHNTDRKGIVAAFGKNGKFLHSALAALSPDDVVKLFNSLGVETKIESTGKIFPSSDRSVHVRDALVRLLEQTSCALQIESPIRNICFEHGRFQLETELQNLSSEKVIVTCGGQSYPRCGTSGDGYPWAEAFGHTIVSPIPALAPVVLNELWPRELSGITLDDVEVSVLNGENKILEKRRGSFLFTHTGCSGPSAMNVSRAIERHRGEHLNLRLDFIPNVNEERLWEQIWQQRGQSGTQTVGQLFAQNGLSSLPRRLIERILVAANTSIDERAAEVGKSKLRTAVRMAKSTLVKIGGTRGFDKAEVTSGGVNLKEVNSSTMESKLQPGLFFAGEILDLDGPIGGFNFQAAFSTGWLAGENV